MKKIILIVALIATGLMQKTFAQDSTAQYLQKVITDYLNAKNALTKDNADSVSAYAKILSADLQSMPMEKLSADKHEIWDHYYEALINDAKEIASNADLKHQREHFADLSSTFYKMAKAMEMNTIDLYYQYCPMADAYWISEKSKISNPYMGKKMPTCGSTKETLKTKQ
jgi:hypothetical protein